MRSEVIAVLRRVKLNGGVEIVLEGLDVPDDHLRPACYVDILIHVHASELVGKGMGVDRAVLLQYGGQLDQPYQLFLVDWHRFNLPVNHVIES